MGQGFPDFAGSLTARHAAAEALLVGSAAANQYSAPAGLLELREEVSRLYARLYPGDAYDPASEVVICTSGQESLNAALRACVSEQVSRGGRDGVIVFEPYFPFTQGALDNAPAVMQPVRTHAPGFAIDAAALRAAVTPRTGTVLLNSPHNPTGHVATEAELAAVAEVCIEHDLLAVSDDVYEHAVFGEGCRHRRLCDVPGMRERTITVSSAGKLFSLTGWRGWRGRWRRRASPPRSHQHTRTSPTPRPRRCKPASLPPCERKTAPSAAWRSSSAPTLSCWPRRRASTSRCSHLSSLCVSRALREGREKKGNLLAPSP